MDYTAQRVIPPGAGRIANKSGSAVVYAYTRGSKLCALGFTGKARNQSFRYSFGSQAKRAAYVAEFLRNADAAAARRAATAVERKTVLAKPTTLVLGDVLSCSWGYDQTNVEYFEITKICGARTIEIRKIKALREDTGFMTGLCVPTKGDYVSEPMRKKVSANETVRIYSFASAYKVESQKVAGMEMFTPQGWTAYA